MSAADELAVEDIEVTEAAEAAEAGEGDAPAVDPSNPSRILVSSSRKPITYINLCKRMLQEHGEVQLSALGIAMSSMVTVAEILKSRNLAVEKRVGTSLEQLTDGGARPRQKPKMEVVLVKSDAFDEIIAAEAEEEAVAGRVGKDDDEGGAHDADGGADT